MATRFWRFLKDQSGTTALEFALIAAPLLMFTFGITEFGRAVFMQQSLSHATDRAARRLYIQPTATAAEIKAGIVADTFLMDPAQLQVQVGPVTVPAGTDAFRTVLLTVDYTFVSVMPDWVTDRIPLSFQRTVVLDR